MDCKICVMCNQLCGNDADIEYNYKYECCDECVDEVKSEIEAYWDI